MSRPLRLLGSIVPNLALVLASALVAVTLVVHAQDAGAHAAEPVVECNEQQPQDFLVRGNFAGRGRFTPQQLRQRHDNAEHAIRYRTEQYGRFAPFGRADWNASAPSVFATTVRFFGLRTRVNQKIAPAIKCAEREIVRACAGSPYVPERLSGLRDHNTYRGGEVSNHVFGIAMDIDPMKNTCCGCVPPWNDAPLCHQEGLTTYQRMAMPECWVHSFEKYGFYWLGHDQLMDTMHFEFLGDPDRIVRQ